MKSKIINSIKANYLLFALLLYGIFLIFYKWSGSFMGDEAIYSQVAKESLDTNSFFVLHWKGEVWFEKPPLIIWLTALAFKFFGVSETAAHLFPGIFGVLSSTVLYFLGKTIFKSKLAGFLSGFVFLTIPMVALYNRANMMDLPVGMFISLCVLAIWKIFSGHQKWWLVFGGVMGLAVLAKSAVGLLPVGLLFFAVLIWQKKELWKDKFLGYGAILFSAIVLPWHLFMTVKFGNLFWQDYFGFHVWKRFSSPIFSYLGENASPYVYLKVFLERTGIWFWLFLFFGGYLIWQLVFVGKWASKEKKDDPFQLWAKGFSREWLFLAAWILLMTVPFILARTKLPTYMLLAFFPFALSVGSFLAYAFEKGRMRIILFVSALSLLNFLPAMQLNASDFGEAHFLIPKLLVRFLGFGEKGLAWTLFFSSAFLIFLFFKATRFPRAFIVIVATLMAGMNLLVPFHPKRNEFIKNLSRDISVLVENEPVRVYFRIRPEQYPWPNVAAFYLPQGSVSSSLDEERVLILSQDKRDSSELCFIERSFWNEAAKKQAIFYYPEGIIIKCKIEDD